MTAFEVLFRVKHGGALLKLSERHPNIRVYTWCNRVNEVLEVEVSDLSEYGEVLKEVSRVATVIGESGDGGIHVIESTCFCTPQNSVGMNVEDLPVLVVSPEVMKGGWEHYRLVFFRHEDFTEVVRRLDGRGFTIEVLEKSEIKGSLAGSLLEADFVFSALTGKQMDAMIRAYGHGYYRLPRSADIQEIARREKVKRTTFQEHLKKGENKIIERIIPYMRLYTSRAGVQSGDAVRLLSPDEGDEP
jgi:predicted DNA binding protein